MLAGPNDRGEAPTSVTVGGSAHELAEPLELTEAPTPTRPISSGAATTSVQGERAGSVSTAGGSHTGALDLAWYRAGTAASTATAGGVHADMLACPTGQASGPVSLGQASPAVQKYQSGLPYPYCTTFLEPCLEPTLWDATDVWNRLTFPVGRNVGPDRHRGSRPKLGRPQIGRAGHSQRDRDGR